MSEIRTYVTGGDRITIEHSRELDGGGTWISVDYLDTLEKAYPNRKFNKALEWCSGPGFIGFELLARKICNEMDFMDLHMPALDNIKQTICKNNLSYNINCILADKIEQLPPKKYDLIVGNPPHFTKKVFPQHAYEDFCRRTLDIDLKIHRNFFEEISNYLADDGIILISETYFKGMRNNKLFEAGIHYHQLSPMIAQNGFRMTTLHSNEYLHYLVIEKNR
jgi:methylase of polypeptide subunit release factors